MERNRIIMPDNPETGGVATITPDNTPRVEDRPETSEAGRTPTENRIPDPENTHDTFTYIDEGLARIQKEQIAQTKANSRFQNALEMAESDPAIKRAIEENRIAYFNRLLDEERRQLEGSDGQGRVRGRRERLREPNEDEEIIPVKTNLGTLREDIILPKDPERKLDYMRMVLGNIEASKEPDGGEVNKQLYHDLAAAISGLRQDEDEDGEIKRQRRELGEKMYHEFEARSTFHGVHLQYQKADSAAAVFGTLNQLRADQLNALFRIPGVAQALSLYENEAERVLRSDVEQLESIRQEFGTRPELVNALPLTESTIDKIAPVRVAERLWEVTGRRAVRDRLEPKDPIKDPKSQLETGDVVFIGSAGGGNFAERRILKMIDWMRTQAKLYKPHIELIKGVDFNTPDYISDLVGTYETAIKTKLLSQYTRDIERYSREGGEESSIHRQFQDLYNQYLSQGVIEFNEKGISKNNAATKIDQDKDSQEVTQNKKEIASKKAIERLAITNAYNEAKEIFGMSKLKKRKENGEEYGDESEGDWEGLVEWKQKDGKWVKEKKLLDAPKIDQMTAQGPPEFINKIRWDKIDFGLLGDNPMLGWALYKLQYPDSLRPILVSEKADTYLRKPTYEGLKAMNDTLVYLGNDWHGVKEKMLENLIVFQRKQQRKETGKFNISLLEGDQIINQALNDKFINQDEAKKAKETLWKTSWFPILKDKQLIFSFFNPFFFLFATFWDAFKKGNTFK